MSLDMLTKQETQALVAKARQGMQNAYCPRSNFPVGAAVLAKDGTLYQGCNVESVISGLGTCAERCAIDNACANGAYTFKAIAIITTQAQPVKPCGACLHYLSEFSQVGRNDIIILTVDKSGKKMKQTTIRKALPGAFGPRDLKLNLAKYEK